MNEALDLSIIGDMDQTNITDPSWAITQIQEIIEKSIQERDVEIAMRTFHNLREVAKISGLTLAKGIYEIYKHWDVFGIEDSCIDYIYTRLGLTRDTVDRYIRIWKMYAENVVPPEYVSRIQSLNIQHQVPIANAIAQGHEIKDDDWKRLAHAPDGISVSMIVHEIKHQPSRSSATHLMIDRDGTLWVQGRDHQKIFVGSLEVGSDDELVQKAVNRIINNAGIMQI